MRAVVNVYAFVSATPGGPQMKSQMENQFTGSGDSTTGGSLAIVDNLKDVVPHGWNTSDPQDPLNMYELPGLYGIPFLKTPPTAGSRILALISGAISVSIYERNKARSNPDFPNLYDHGNKCATATAGRHSLSKRYEDERMDELRLPEFQPARDPQLSGGGALPHVCAYDVLLGMKGTLNTASHQCGQKNQPAND